MGGKSVPLDRKAHARALRWECAWGHRLVQDEHRRKAGQIRGGAWGWMQIVEGLGNRREALGLAPSGGGSPWRVLSQQ